jgi:hypothetical protein
MSARHPITGEPIKIMRTEAQISRDMKTLVYLDETAEPSVKWSRWQTIISNKESLSVLNSLLPNYILLHNELLAEDVEFWKSWLTIKKREIYLVFVSAKIAEQLGQDTLQDLNIICYNEMYDLYPFIEEPLTDETPLLEVLVSIATVLRFNRLYMSLSLPAPKNEAILSRHGGSVILAKLAVSLVPRFVLIQQYFQHPLNRRSRELKECLLRNIRNPYIDEIHLINEKRFIDEKGNEWMRNPKVREYDIGVRISYDAVFRHIRENVPKNSIVAFANTDIYFDATIRQLYSVSLKKRFLSLLRWDDPNMPQFEGDDCQPCKLFGPRPDSQDTWIVLSDDITFDPNTDDFKIPFGKPGCDNAVNVAMLKQRFLICNPAYSIKTYHIHLSAIRDYNPQDIVRKPIYLYIDPTAIQEYSVVNTLSSTAPFIKGDKETNRKTTSVRRRIQYVDENSAATICSMLKREKRWSFLHNDDNEFVFEENSVKNTTIHEMENKFISPQGLVYGMNQIFIGTNQLWKEAWEEANTNILATTLHVPTLISHWFPKSIHTSIQLWALNYLSRVLPIRKAIQQKNGIIPEFLVCEKEGVADFLSMLQWKDDKRVAMVPFDEKLQYYADKLYVVEPRIGNEFVTSEEIKTLRDLLPEPKTDTDNKGIVVFAVEDDDEILSLAWLERIHATSFKEWSVHRIGSKTPANEIVPILQKADVFIGQADSKWDSLSWMWCMRPETSVVEVMRDTKPRGDNIHLAGVSSIRYTLIVAKREPIDLQREHALRDIHLAVKNLCYDISMKTAIKLEDRPVIILPVDQSGLHEHAGDTFREMVEIWEKKGYVTVRRTSNTPYVWLNRIGSVLLYDRPTLRWLNPDLLYEFGFFGNCTPPLESTYKATVWSFWPRSPVAVENFVSRTSLPSYEQRPVESIFLGKVENGVQMKNRSKSDWSAVIKKWSMPVDSTGKEYVYSQEEYLLEVSKARFGLALAGYGNKCNREIEYFALGTVPICSPEVDMKHYLRPPQEGVHYLRVLSANEVPAKIASITPKKWTEMSRACHQWWLENASAEGMFRLTMATAKKVQQVIS